VERVFVAFGGSDPEDYTALVLSAWIRRGGLPALEILVGPAYPHMERLLDGAAKGHAHVHRDLDGNAVADLMKSCDLAVASASMVACELAALGIPSLLVVGSEDQRCNARAFAEAGAAVVADLARVDLLVEEARRLVDDQEKRRALSTTANQLVDGMGALRVAEAMLERT
jgi:spore coat polysaccharide biosynthesis predicted glycosyltransferase SpsG